MRTVGILWLIAAISFAAAGFGLVILQPWWSALAVAAAEFSLLLCVLGWPETRIGALVDLAVLGFLFFVRMRVVVT